MSKRRSEAERLIEEAMGLAIADNMCEITRRLRQQCRNGVASVGVSEKGKPLLHPDSHMKFIYLAENNSKTPDVMFTDLTE
jgi:hypothetical protein